MLEVKILQKHKVILVCVPFLKTASLGLIQIEI